MRRLRMRFGGSHTEREWQELKTRIGNACVCCGAKEPDVTLTRDHIVPLVKGGTNDIENIQPLCVSCNKKKHTRIVNYIAGYEVENEALVPDEYRAVSRTKIALVVQALKENATIPGVRVFSRKEPRIGGRKQPTSEPTAAPATAQASGEDLWG